MYIPMVIMWIKLFIQILHKEVTSDMWWGVESRGNRDFFSPNPDRQECQIAGLTSANQVTYYSTILLRDSSSTNAVNTFLADSNFKEPLQDVVIPTNLSQQGSSHKKQKLISSWPLQFLVSVICLFVSHKFEFYHFSSTLVVCLSQHSDKPGRWVIISSD